MTGTPMMAVAMTKDIAEAATFHSRASADVATTAAMASTGGLGS